MKGLFDDDDVKNTETREHQPERELTQFEKMALGEQEKARQKAEAFEEYQREQQLAYIHKANQLAQGPSLREKDWEEIKRLDFAFYLSPEAKQVREKHRQKLGVLFYSKGGVV